MSFRELCADIRSSAMDVGITLTMAKLNDAIAFSFYGKHYSAVVAADKAGALEPLRFPPPYVREACERYALDPEAFSEAIGYAHENWEQEEAERRYPIRLHAAVKRLIQNTEAGLLRSGEHWASFECVDDVHDAFGDAETMELDDLDGDFNDLVDKAISTDGRSLTQGLRAMEKRLRQEVADSSEIDTSWIDAIESHYKTLPANKAKKREPYRTAIMLWLKPFPPEDRPVYTNAETLPYDELHDLIVKATRMPKGVLRIGNDFVDIVSAQMRMASGIQSQVDCYDVCQSLMDMAHEGGGSVLDTRKAWNRFNAVKDRRRAPPPAGIPLLLETHDFNEGARALGHLRIILGITTGTMEGLLDPEHASPFGHIAPTVVTFFEKYSRIKFENGVILGNPYLDPSQRKRMAARTGSLMP